MNPHRRNGPPITSITKLTLPDVEILDLSNGMKMAIIHQEQYNVLKLEYFFRAGRSVETKKLISRATASLLKEGAGDMLSGKIADAIDYYGASIKTSSNMDYSYVSLHMMSKHLPYLVPVITEMLTRPRFDAEEIEKFKRLNIEKLKEELAKCEVVAYRELTEEIFGGSHPYGYNSEIADYESINREDLLEHFHNAYGANTSYIFVSGDVNPTVRKCIIETVENMAPMSSLIDFTSSKVPIGPSKKLITSTTNMHQSAIKMGRRLFDKHHPDNPDVFLLNALLGGYFGSRLMTNIREDKGYTYDIFSSMDQMLYDGYFSISTETTPKYVEPLIQDIYLEIEKLQNDPIPQEELTMVKNYLMGSFMNLLDGPLNSISFVKTMVLTDQKLDEFHTFVDKILDLTSTDMNLTAQKYLQTDMLKTVIVSPKLSKK
jgi:zinc protease